MKKTRTLGEAVEGELLKIGRATLYRYGHNEARAIAKFTAAEIRRRLKAKFRKSKDSLIDVGWDTALNEAVEVTKWRK